MSKSAELAQAIVDAINAATLPIAVDAKRRSTPFSEDDQELADVQVSVYVGTKATSQNTRGTRLKVYKPVVTVTKRLTNAADAIQTEEADQLIDLVNAIEEAVGVTLAGCGFQKFDEEQDRDSYNMAALQLSGCFAVPIVLEYWGE